MAGAEMQRGRGAWGSALAMRKAQWRDAMRWRRRLEAAIARSGLTFLQWRVLDGTARLVSETGDAVSQNQVAVHLELDRMTVSNVMTALANKGLVDRGPSMSGTAWRVIVTGEAADLLRTYEYDIETASALDG